MAPSAIVEPPVQNASTTTLTLPLEKDRKRASEAASAYSSRMFRDALLEQNRVKSSSRVLDILVSILLHITVLSIPIFLGLYFTQTINLKDFSTMFLVAPPPPPPPPPAPTKLMKVTPPKRVFTAAGKLLAPTVIPKQVAMIKEEPLPPEAMGGVEGGVPGGVPGGQLGGVIGGVIGGIGTTKAPAPVEKKIVRVGGRVRPPTVIRRIEPVYPTLARAAHVQGDVVVDAILDEQGNVTEMKIVSGPPLLYQAALEALSQWKYQPTYLNDEPVSVQFIVTISFRLNQ
jgi:periplasmic protein TonB